MPKRLRKNLQGTVFHVMNRAVRRTVLFETERDYDAFVQLAVESLEKAPIKIIAYCLMPNHWHFVTICERIAHLSNWMHWLESTHANRWNGAHGTRGTGAVYQDRFKAVPVQKNRSLIRACRYVERNALRAGLVERSELWRWSSLYSTWNNCVVIPLSEWPITRPSNWRELVNLPETEAEFDDLRRMIRRNQPIGSPAWQEAVAPFIGQTMKGKGRPKKPSQN
jgi:putative transposase